MQVTGLRYCEAANYLQGKRTATQSGLDERVSGVSRRRIGGNGSSVNNKQYDARYIDPLLNGLTEQILQLNIEGMPKSTPSLYIALERIKDNPVEYTSSCIS